MPDGLGVRARARPVRSSACLVPSAAVRDRWAADSAMGWGVRLGLKLVGVGLIIGIAASLATNRLLVSQLWNTSPNDPLTFGVAIAAIITMAALACWVPARRAVRVEPMVALRHE